MLLKIFVQIHVVRGEHDRARLRVHRNELRLIGVLAAAAVAPRRKRRHPRHQVSSLAYVNVNQGNGGIIRDLAETGIAIQAVAPLQASEQVQLRFELVSPRLRVETMGRVAWADSGGQAGIEFTALPRRSHRLLKDWLFTHLLSSAQNAAWDTLFTNGKSGAESQLQFSAVARPPIRLPASVSTELVSNEARRATLRILGVRVGIQPHVLSRLLDGLILPDGISYGSGAHERYCVPVRVLV